MYYTRGSAVIVKKNRSCHLDGFTRFQHPWIRKCIVVYRPVAKSWLWKHQTLLGNARTQHLRRCHDTWDAQPLLSSDRSIRVCDDVTQQKRWCRRCSLWARSEAIWLDRPYSAQRLSAVQSRIQLWSVNQRATEVVEISIAKIRYQETSSEDVAEE
jgi:hypothetical protein